VDLRKSFGGKGLEMEYHTPIILYRRPVVNT